MKRTILDEIVEHKKTEVVERRLRVSQSDLESAARAAPAVRNFTAALSGKGVSLIAEVKKASPSAGVIRADFDPLSIAQAYESGGASAISVLTDEKYFQGSLECLSAIRRSVSLPCLRKDFVIDEYQIFEARARGADAILLILNILTDAQLKAFLQVARQLRMSCLVESHSREELERAISSGAVLLGINNRDLHTFKTDLQTTVTLMPMIPAGRIVVSESGIRNHEDVQRLEAAGVSAILIGETLMRSRDVSAAIATLLGRPRCIG